MPQLPGFTLLELLYNSSTTMVYRAIRETDGVSVILRLSESKDSTSIPFSRLALNYDVLSRFKHPNIVAAYDWLPDLPQPILVLEDIHGVDLWKFSESFENKQLPLEAFLEVAIQIADALSVVHHHQVIHKDLHPGNIIVNPKTLQVQIIDFGLASLLNRQNPVLSSPDHIEGILAYISPEQTGRMNRALDYRTDFYTLGVTFYLLLTGRLPFQADDSLGVVYAHMALRQVPVTHLRPDLPPIISNIVDKLLSKNAEDRYQSALGILSDLKQCLDELNTRGTISQFTVAQNDLSDRFQIPQVLYGRQPELKALMEHFEQAEQGHPQLFSVSGYSGIGKSALVNEVHKPVTAHNGVFISGKFDQFQQNTPYYALKQALSVWVNEALCLPEHELAALRTSIVGCLGASCRVLIDFMPEFEPVLGTFAPLPELSDSAVRFRFHQTFQKFIRSVSIRQPWVIFIDDLQWADRGTLTLLGELMREPDLRLLLIVAYRSNAVNEHHAAMKMIKSVISLSKDICTQVELTALEVPEIAQLLSESLFQDKDSVNDLAQLVYGKAGGNPFFTIEFLKTLYAEDLLHFDLDARCWQWDIKKIEAESITDNVVELMLDKMSVLPKETQALLQLASCVGSSFDLHTLSVISQQELHACAKALWPALEMGLLLEQGGDWFLGLVEGATESPIQHAKASANDAGRAVSSMSASRRSNTSLRSGKTLAATAFIPQCRFIHDRMLQAAYESLSDDQRASAHLTIGRLLRDHYFQADQQSSSEETSEHSLDVSELFEVVEQLNSGRAKITNVEEKLQLAQLNLQALNLAKKASVWDASLNYANIGLSLLPDSPFEQCYSICFDLSFQRFQLELLCNLGDQGRNHGEVLLAKAKTTAEQIQVILVLSDVQFNSNQFTYCLEMGIKGLALCDMDLARPEAVTPALIEQETERLNSSFEGQIFTISELESKNCSETELYALKFFANMALIGQIGGLAEFHKYVILRQAALGYQCGIGEHSILCYAGYASSLVKQSRYEEAQQFSQLMLALIERYPHSPDLPYAYNCIGALIYHYGHPFKECIALLDHCHSIGYEYGDVIRGVFSSCSNSIVYSYAAGLPISSVLERSDALDAVIKKHGLFISGGYLYRPLLERLSGVSSDNYESKVQLLFTSENFTEAQWLQIQSMVVKAFVEHLNLQWFFWSDQWSLAESALLDAEPSLEASKGFVIHIEHTYLGALIACRQGADSALERYIDLALDELSVLSRLCPENYEHKRVLLKAEQGRIQGLPVEHLMPLYEQAIAQAGEHGFLQYQAYANECYGLLWLERGSDTIANVYLQRAVNAYQHWGNTVKVDSLIVQYPGLLKPISKNTDAPSSMMSLGTEASLGIRQHSLVSDGVQSELDVSRSSDRLDLASVMKSAQAISGELEQQSLITKVLKIILENSGAQSGAVVLNHPMRGASIEALMQTRTTTELASDQTVLIESQPLQDSQDVPISVIGYVLRLDKDVVLQQAITQHAFSKDPYLLKHKPQSLLCVPIDYRDKAIGALYLQNELIANAFPKERLGVIKMLLAQAAISFENARLFEEVTDLNVGLERKVEERTRALKDAQSQLVEAEKMASLGEVVRGVAHEMNTPLGIATTAGSIVSDAIDALEEKFNGKALTTKYLKNFLENTKGSAELLNNNLKRSSELVQLFKRISVDEVVEEVSEFSLCAHLRMLSDQCMPVLAPGQHTLSIHCDNAFMLTSYAEVLSNVLRQLIQNAVIHGFEHKEQGRIDVTAALSEPEGDYVQIRVSDNGCGMSEDMVEKVFDPFVTTKRGVMGQIGLGNHIVYNLVTQKLNGTILCESTEGEGTCFTLCLPYLPV